MFVYVGACASVLSTNILLTFLYLRRLCLEPRVGFSLLAPLMGRESGAPGPGRCSSVKGTPSSSPLPGRGRGAATHGHTVCPLGPFLFYVL